MAGTESQSDTLCAESACALRIRAIALHALPRIAIVTYVAVIVKTLKQSNSVHTHDVLFVQCVNPSYIA
ncbi:hypothetical protein SAMD00079811_70640 [Scytonema sp. HK-05]|nr:hypothetical protein SAMD00079811_70640 [Scytonema sp. HK-05]